MIPPYHINYIHEVKNDSRVHLNHFQGCAYMVFILYLIHIFQPTVECGKYQAHLSIIVLCGRDDTISNLITHSCYEVKKIILMCILTIFKGGTRQWYSFYTQILISTNVGIGG